MRFFALQRLQPGRSTKPRALPARCGSVLGVWLPPRRIAPSPTSPDLFQTGCAPGLRPSEVAQRLWWNGIPAFPDRPGGWKPVRRAALLARSNGRFLRLSALPRKRARRSMPAVTPSPGSRLSWAFPLCGLFFGRLGPSFGKPPPAGLARSRSPANEKPATRRIHTDRPFRSVIRRPKPAKALPYGKVRTRTPL